MRILPEARPWAEAGPESSSGHGLDAGDGELFGCLLDGDWGLGSRRGAMRSLGVLEHDTGLVN